MFYSHNLLARKGPLGTVWCAAHLQNKLKKSNYVTVNIPSTVEQIMNPQVPIALRMSGHLLLGVVRIYSKKVEYLHHDYNVLRIDISKVYTYININLPEEANQATFESITLPENFELDLFNVDAYDPYGSPDKHIRRHEDISLNDQSQISLSKNGDQTPAGYIMISFNEDVSRTPSVSRPNSQSSPMPIEGSPQSLPPPETNAGVEEPDPNNQMGSGDDENETPPVLLHDNYFDMHFSMPSDTEEPDLDLVEQFEKDDGSSVPDEVSVPDVSPVNKQTPPLDSADSGPADDNSDPLVSFGLASPSMVVRPSPLVEPALEAEQQPRAKRRKIPKRRKIRFDKSTDFTKENDFPDEADYGFMNEYLDDPSNLLRKRKEVCSPLDVWKLNNSFKKEKVIFDPVTTGLCHNLSQMFDTGYKSTKPRVVQAEEDDMEPERICDIVGPDDNNTIPTCSTGGMTDMPTPDNGASSSPREMDEYTPGIGTNDVGSKSCQVQMSVGTGVEGSTPDPTSSSTHVFSDDMETSTEFSQGHQGFDNSGGLSDISEEDDAGELTFLEDDEGMPTPPEIGSLLASTRAVAQYIKERSSSATRSTPEREGAVSLNSILVGKSRKVCARMFMETLILKSCELVDVKQDEAYGDITLKVTSKLLKQQF